ncbi:hypothetical protein EGJ27_02950 [Pseudomonas sp. v388]|nr:hypothetical protein EGJ27_02950 [Pseudomonas sp. v388]
MHSATKSNCVLKSNVFAITSATSKADESDAAEPLPAEVRQAMAYDWGVFVDAYLCNGARVGDRYAATAYFGQPGEIPNGATVATHPLRQVATHGSFRLFQTLDGADHYVLVSQQSVGGGNGNRD